MSSAIRQDPRLPCDLDAILTEADERRRVRVVDISRSGALVEVSPLPEIGQQIRLQFSLPVAEDAIIAEAIVMRQLTYECGVHFTELPPEALGTLEKYLFVRTCQFGWLSTRRLFASWRQLVATLTVTLLAAFMLIFGGRQLVVSMAPAMNSGTWEFLLPWLDLALVCLAMAPPAAATTLGYGLHLAPPDVRDVLLFGSDPSGALHANIDSIRRAFGLSRQETESLLDIHVADWRLPTARVRVSIRLLFVFALFYAFLCVLVA